MTPLEFIDVVTKILPHFDGKPENLKQFINALNILESIKETHELLAVSLIKTKLSNNASRLLTNETTIEQVIKSLTANVKFESSQNTAARLSNTKQNNKNDNDYAKEIETLAIQLESAYVTEGTARHLAKAYAAQAACKTLKTNSKSDEVKMLMRAGQFSTVSDAITKFIELSTESRGTVQIN